jgi:cellulose synthase/poly-beta-1,6-N-acetylglucosamine synthase-like glycosyltransferase
VTFVVVLWLFYLVTVVVALARGGALANSTQLVTTITFLVSVSLLTFSACMYLLARSAALPRFAAHRRARRIALDEHISQMERMPQSAASEQGTPSDPRLVALLPSRSEDPEMVLMSLWSVALQEFPNLHVVLLLDDDPDPADPADRESLERSRMLAAEIMMELQPIRARIEAASARLRGSGSGDGEPLSAIQATELVMREHAAAAQWLRARADAAPLHSHVDVFYVNHVLRGLATSLDATAAALHTAVENGESPLPHGRAEQVLARLVNIFSVEMSVFERKRYNSLSHAPNKAMNLNSYLGLLGGQYREQHTGYGLSLVPVSDAEAARSDPSEIITAPNSEYVLTLDADSMILPEYCLRLLHLLDHPDNNRIAVAQTPYSAYRGAPTRVERLSGATTDLQHIVHQGLTAFGATYWVGANAVLRRSALEDIRRETTEDGVRVVRFISDRTVIEDTESSIEIAAHGWSLMNYPERLSYSATPPDFGTLVIQRRRWADGGLLILPRLSELIVSRRRQGTPLRMTEKMLRANYLGSITWVTLGLLAVLSLNPLGGQLITIQLLLIAVPYFIEMASDLRYLGYRRRDVLGIYGLNLLLLPVNLAGTLASLWHALTGRKARFMRTPKVSTRTPTPALYIVAPLLIAAGATIIALRAGFAADWGTTTFASFTAGATLWAIARLIGIRHALSDLWFGWMNWIWVDSPRPAEAVPSHVPVWLSVVDDGPLETIGALR